MSALAWQQEAPLLKHQPGSVCNWEHDLVWPSIHPSLHPSSQVTTWCGAGGMDIVTRVTRRSESLPADDRIETSEYIQQVSAR